MDMFKELRNEMFKDVFEDIVKKLVNIYEFFGIVNGNNSVVYEGKDGRIHKMTVISEVLEGKTLEEIGEQYKQEAQINTVLHPDSVVDVIDRTKNKKND